MEILPRPVRGVIQEALRVPPIREAGHVAYRLCARWAASRLARVPCVRTVLLTGSMTRPGACEPGYSDIDFILGVDVPTLEDELRFRRALAKELRLLSLFVPMDSLDYFPSSDLDFLRRHAGAWTLDLDRRWRVVAGAPLAGDAVERGATERRLLLLAADMRRWAKGSGAVFEERSPASEYARQRVARRILTDSLSGWLGLDRHDPLPVMLAAIQAHPAAPAELSKAARESLEGDHLSHREICIRLVSTALATLDASAREFSEGWSEDFDIEGEVPPLAADGPHRAFVEAALHEVAITSCFIVPGGSSTRPDFIACVCHDGTSPREAVETLERLIHLGAEHDLGTRPVLLTPSMYRAAAALDPTPMLGASLSASEAFAGGARIPPPPAPPRELLDLFIRQRLGRYLYQMQGREFRRVKGDEAARRAVWTDLRVSRQLMRSLRSGKIAIELPTPPRELPSSETLVAEIREARESIRESLEGA